MRGAAPAIALALVLGIGAAAAPADNGFVYTPATLPAATVGEDYDVTMSVAQNGQPDDLSWGQTLYTSTEAAPGIKVKQVKVDGKYGLELVGTPTKAGTYTFTTCAGNGIDCGPASWTLVVNGKAPPGWLKRAQDAKAALEQALRYENAAETALTDFEFPKAEKLLQKSLGELTSVKFGRLPHGAPSKGGVRADLFDAEVGGTTAESHDRYAEQDAKRADGETGKAEEHARKAALDWLSTAIHGKLEGIAALDKAIAVGESG